VPAYNIKEHIQRAIDSILTQTFTDFECIIVDDVSTDGTSDILNLYRDDKRIEIVRHTQNLGPGLARNTGIEKAKGKYIFFVDSDDWIEQGTLEKLYTAAKNEDTDITACGIRCVYEDGTTDIYHSNSIKNSGGPSSLELLSQHVISDVVWNKLYKKDFLDKYSLRFPPKYYEDVIFSLEVLYYCNSYISIPDQLYNYYQSSQSITRRKISSKHIDSYIEIFTWFNRFLKRDKALQKVSESVNNSILQAAIYKTLSFYEETDDQTLDSVFERQFGDGYFYIKGMIEFLINENKRLKKKIQPIVLKQIENKRVVFFGTGSACQTIFRSFPLKVQYFIDNNKNKWGTNINNVIIYDPIILLTEKKSDLAIIVASQYYDEIAGQLTRMGFSENQHFWDGYGIFNE
jgi:glycosyltransferase involved in cell wall biosynthesis